MTGDGADFSAGRSRSSMLLVVVLAVLAALPPVALLVTSITGREQGASGVAIPAASTPATRVPAATSGAAASAGAAPRSSGGVPQVDAATAEAAARWVREAVDPSVRLVATDPLVPALARAGHPSDNLRVYDPAEVPAEPVRWDADLVVVSPDLRAALPGEDIQRELRNLPVIARFGTGDAALQVRQVVDRDDPAVRAAAQRDRSQRVRQAAALLDDPALLIREDARSQLVSGTVDTRVLALLDRLTPQFRLTVADFPARPEEVSTRPRRTVQIAAVDGIPVSATSARTRELLDAVAGLPAPPQARVAAAAGSGTGGDVLVVQFPLVPASR